MLLMWVLTVVGEIDSRSAISSQRDDAHGCGEFFRESDLEEDSVGARAQGGTGVLVAVGCDQHEHPRGESACRIGARRLGMAVGLGDATYCLNEVGVRSAQVQEDDVGLERGGGSDCLDAVGRLAHDREVGLGFQEHAQAETLKGLVVDDEYGGHAGVLPADRVRRRSAAMFGAGRSRG